MLTRDSRGTPAKYFALLGVAVELALPGPRRLRQGENQIVPASAGRHLGGYVNPPRRRSWDACGHTYVKGAAQT